MHAVCGRSREFSDGAKLEGGAERLHVSSESLQEGTRRLGERRKEGELAETGRSPSGRWEAAGRCLYREFLPCGEAVSDLTQPISSCTPATPALCQNGQWGAGHGGPPEHGSPQPSGAVHQSHGVL